MSKFMAGQIIRVKSDAFAKSYEADLHQPSCYNCKNYERKGQNENDYHS